MARNPKQDANLKPIKKGELSKEEAKRRGKKGAEASARTRRALKSFKEELSEGLTKEEQEIMLRALKRNAQRGNLACFEFLLKMLGQHPDQGGGEDQTITIKIQGGDAYGD